MRLSYLQYGLLILFLNIIVVNGYPIHISDGHWIPIGEDYLTYFESLDSHSQWVFNAMRGPNDRWGINLTTSGFGYHPTTVIIWNKTEYHQWVQTGSFAQCHFIQSVNYSLHTTVDLPYQSQWYLILNNTGPVNLYFSLRLTCYHWTNTRSPTTTIPAEGIYTLFIYIVLIGIIVFVIIPCICRFRFFRLFRRCRDANSQNKETHNQTIILVITPEQLEQYKNDEENSH